MHEAISLGIDAPPVMAPILAAVEQGVFLTTRDHYVTPAAARPSAARLPGVQRLGDLSKKASGSQKSAVTESHAIGDAAPIT